MKTVAVRCTVCRERWHRVARYTEVGAVDVSKVCRKTCPCGGVVYLAAKAHLDLPASVCNTADEVLDDRDMDIVIFQDEAERETFYTDAPPCLDGFGTVTTKANYAKRGSVTFRRVSVRKDATTWQFSRYNSEGFCFLSEERAAELFRQGEFIACG